MDGCPEEGVQDGSGRRRGAAAEGGQPGGDQEEQARGQPPQEEAGTSPPGWAAGLRATFPGPFRDRKEGAFSSFCSILLLLPTISVLFCSLVGSCRSIWR